MKILFIADPLDSFKLSKDSTYAMMVEAAKRGHDLYFALQEGLMWKGGRVLAECRRISLHRRDRPWYRADAAARRISRSSTRC
jgi:glutathione synthase